MLLELRKQTSLTLLSLTYCMNDTVHRIALYMSSEQAHVALHGSSNKFAVNVNTTLKRVLIY